MSLLLELNLEDDVSRLLDQLGNRLEDRVKLNERIGGDVLALVQDYLTNIANDRHPTAEELGAQPTGFWDNPGGYTKAVTTPEQVSIEIRHAGIGRAAHDVTIEPGPGKQFLTLPLIAEAYGQRAAGMEGLFVLRSHEGALFLARHSDRQSESGLTVLYLLVRSVTQPQDETLLPPEDAFLQTALQACDEYFDAVLAGRAA